MPGTLRSLLALLALFGVAIVIAWLTFRPEQRPLPTGSSHSFEADGAQALYLWSQALGARVTRVNAPVVVPEAGSSLLFIIEPERPIAFTTSRAELDRVARAGGTLVVAGESASVRSYLGALNVDAELTPTVSFATHVETGAILPITSRARLRAEGATPLLVAANGDWLALRKPYLDGTLIAISTSEPLTNEALRHSGIARWVYRDILQGIGPGTMVAFDEAHYLFSAAAPVAAPSFEDLVRESLVGRAVVYAALLTFLYLLLAGRHFGPPLPAFNPGGASRTMFEHVQALAGLYRRSGKLQPVRDHYARHYRRVIARSLGLDVALLAPERREQTLTALVAHGIPRPRAAQLTSGLEALDAARSERQLIAAVEYIEDLLIDLPRAGRTSTLSAA